MKPENTNIPNSVEVAPNVPASSMDRLPPVPSPESGLNLGGERSEQVAELSAAQADATSSAIPITLLAQPSVVDDTSASITATTPLTAANDDLIEKEWVDRAKQIVSSTPGDPHARGQQVSALQKDYLKKRFGKELGAA